MDPRRPHDWNPSRKYVSQQLQFRNPYFPRTTPTEKKSHRLRLYFWCAGIVVIGLAYVTVFSGLFRISQIDVTGAHSDHERLIRDVLTDTLGQRHLLVLPDDNGLWTDPPALSRTLMEKLAGQASFEELNVTKSGLKKITVAVKERTATLLWQVDTKQYFLLDGRGVVFNSVTVTDDQPAPDLPLIKNVAKTATTIGSEIITAPQAATITDAVQRLRSRFPEIAINYSTPIVRESVRTVCASDTPKSNVNSNTNGNSNSNTNRNTNTNTSVKNANIRPSNANSNINATSDTNTNSNLNTAAPCETENVATNRYAREVLINVAKDTDIYLSADESIDDQINALGVLLNDKITDINKINYIDVRYLPRAYYK